MVRAVLLGIPQSQAGHVGRNDVAGRNFPPVERVRFVGNVRFGRRQRTDEGVLVDGVRLHRPVRGQRDARAGDGVIARVDGVEEVILPRLTCEGPVVEIKWRCGGSHDDGGGGRGYYGSGLAKPHLIFGEGADEHAERMQVVLGTIIVSIARASRRMKNCFISNLIAEIMELLTPTDQPEGFKCSNANEGEGAKVRPRPVRTRVAVVGGCAKQVKAERTCGKRAGSAGLHCVISYVLYVYVGCAVR